MSSMLDSTFFEKILRRGLQNETVNNVRIEDQSPAVGKGANFLSHLWRFVVKYDLVEQGQSKNSGDEKIISKGKEIKMIVKCEPRENEPGSVLVKEQNIFSTETLMFERILPKIEEILGRKLSPKYFQQVIEDKNSQFLVMEDLQAEGFIMKDRQTGLSQDHVIMVLEAIADYHAATVWLHERDPESTKRFTESIITEKTPLNMIRIFEQTIWMVVEKSRSLVNRNIYEKFVTLAKNFHREILQVCNYDQDEFCVLNHGDLWTNNLMFREDENGKPLEIVLIDYQMSVYSSPVIDLIYFLATCPSQDIRTEKDDFFLGKYIRRLTEKMSQLGCKTRPPTIAYLQRAIAKRRMWMITAAIAFYPRMIADVTEVESFNKLLRTGQTQMNVFKNPQAEVAIRKTLLDMDRRNYLD